MAAPADRIYHGTTSRQDQRGGYDVLVETTDGRQIGPLRHVRRHSPDGFAWGYTGSGPADLARSLLLDALEEDGNCPGCNGSGRIVLDRDTGQEHAFCEATDSGPAATVGDGRTVTLTCWVCLGDGATTVPYHPFKEAVVAHLGDEWRLTRNEVLQWLHSNV